MKDTHLIREAQQIKLLADRIAKVIESDNDKLQDKLNQKIENIDQLNNTVRNFLEVVSSKKTITSEFLTKIHHELRSPLVPILAYADMLLDSKYGSISDEQRKRLEIISSSTKGLVQTIQDLFNKKTFDVTSDNLDTGKDHKINELGQEKKILDRINTALSDDLDKTKKENVKIKKDLADGYHKIKEREQENLFASKSAQDEQEKNFHLQKKHYISIVMIAVLVSGGFAFYSYYENQVLLSTTSYLLKNYSSNYLIQNLQGDTVNTWVSWRLVTGQTLHINIINEANLSPDKIFAIKDAILSTQTVTLDDSLLHKGPPGTSSVYYKGWEGALDTASAQTTQFYIPEKFDIADSSGGVGEILIKLTNDQNPDGLSGYTKSIADGNQILKTTITIFNAGQLSANQLGAITRHEFGHAMGLAHSSAPEDLMHATIQTEYPYISGCDIDAIKGLYNGDEKSQVVCKK